MYAQRSRENVRLKSTKQANELALLQAENQRLREEIEYFKNLSVFYAQSLSTDWPQLCLN